MLPTMVMAHLTNNNPETRGPLNMSVYVLFFPVDLHYFWERRGWDWETETENLSQVTEHHSKTGVKLAGGMVCPANPSPTKQRSK